MNYDFSKLKAGEIEPSLGKKIKEIILCSDTFIVYMDENDVIQWSDNRDTLSENSGEILNQISYWESICNHLFSKEESYDYKTLLAEGYARILSEGKTKAAQDIIDLTVKRIEKQGKEILRQEYLIASLKITAVVAGLSIILFLLNNLSSNILCRGIFEICLSGGMGGIGAFVSTMINAKKYNADITTNKKIHAIDGSLRILYGVIAGVLVAMGIKANIILGFANGINKSIYLYTFLGAIAGASEVFLPNIIKQVEDKV